ncbi:YgaP family membrane protein [Halorarius halobius]|uniref:YgaP family membrane protein n=1 Tax=Halorarius halobius TaxID=2962671 RepID=UPI0020CFC6F1|nr:DUF2892 domain-containing protein [Halorarius halobius]
MDKNVGGMDRNARLVVGPVLAVVGLVLLAGLVSIGQGMLYTVVVPALLLVVGVVLSVTGYTQKCPLNSLLGVNTCPAR